MNVRQLQAEINAAYQNLRFNNKKLLGFLEQFVTLLDFDLVENIEIWEGKDDFILIEVFRKGVWKLKFYNDKCTLTRGGDELFRKDYSFINNSTLCVRSFIKELNLHEEKRD